MRRIVYFLATNAGVMIVFGIILSLLPPSITGGNAFNLLFFPLIFGMGGAFMSLMMSKRSAKKMAGLRMIEQPNNETEQWLINTVTRQAQEAGIGMPEVGIFDAPEMNAFATGAKKNDALVAVSTGLLNSMSREEAEAVMGHEIAHVANGDMVTLTLITGVVNAFVMVAARILAGAMGQRSRMGYFIGYQIGNVLFGFLATMVVSYFSRRREFRADEGGAQYSSTQNMIGALEKLKAGKTQQLPNELAAFGINSKLKKKLFSTHPPLDDRIAALREAQQ